VKWRRLVHSAFAGACVHAHFWSLGTLGRSKACGDPLSTRIKKIESGNVVTRTTYPVPVIANPYIASCCLLCCHRCTCWHPHCLCSPNRTPHCVTLRWLCRCSLPAMSCYAPHLCRVAFTRLSTIVHVASSLCGVTLPSPPCHITRLIVLQFCYQVRGMSMETKFRKAWE